KYLGAPRRSITFLIMSTASLDLIERRGSRSRHSRVNSSMHASHLTARPSASRSWKKSHAQISLGLVASRRLIPLEQSPNRRFLTGFFGTLKPSCLHSRYTRLLFARQPSARSEEHTSELQSR